MKRKRLLLLLALLMTVATGAWAAWTGGTYTAQSNEDLGSIAVTDNATLTIKAGVTVTTGAITISDGKTLTIVGPGGLYVRGSRGSNGSGNSNGTEGGIAITGSGSIIVKGYASLQADGGAGGDGVSGFYGSHGGNGAAAIMCSVTIYSGTITAKGGNGGNGGKGDYDSGKGGNGGNGAPAFAGSVTLTYYGGKVTVYGGTHGNEGIGDDNGEVGNDNTAFASTTTVVLKKTPTILTNENGDPITVDNIKTSKEVWIEDDKSVQPTYAVTMKAGTEDAKNWTIASGEKSATGDAADGLTGLKEGDAVTLSYTGRLKVKSVTATFEPDLIATPLTMEAITAGTIRVYINGELTTGLKYSVNGGTKKEIKTTTSIDGLKAGDKVQFYGNGINTQVYGDAEVRIQGSGDGFQTKVYGNIMSLLDEEGFATKTDLPNENVFYQLFDGNTTLIDASELLLPAATLTNACYHSMFLGCTNLTTAPKLPATTLAKRCYAGMFYGCTNLTTAPKLPATTLATSCYAAMFSYCTSLTTAPKLPATTLAAGCYYYMFNGCTSLTSAYVKAAYTEENDECDSMFTGCTATGAVLHTTPGSKEIWEAMMGSGTYWDNWSVADDWQD